MEAKPLNIINLESLLELSAGLNESDNELFILNSALLSLMGKLRILRSCVFLHEDQEFKAVIAKGKKPFGAIKYFYIDEFKELDKNIETESDLCSAGYKYCFPIKYKNELIAIICLGERPIGGDLSDIEKKYGQMVSAIAANAVQNARSHEKIRIEKNKTELRNQLLSTLFEMARDFSNLLSRKQILKMLSFRLMGQLMVSRFAVLLKSEDGPFSAIVNRFDSSVDAVSVDFDNLDFPTINVKESFCPVEICTLFPDAEIISPMPVKGTVKGVLIVGKSMKGAPFNELDLQFINALGNTAMSALENDRLFHEEIEKKKIENEMFLALDIQKNLLPKESPSVPGFEIVGLSEPSRHVGGDYFDYLKLNDEETLIAIADVSGKGMPASLLMANFQAALRALAKLKLDLEELVVKLNEIVYLNTSADKFITFFCGILNRNTGKFSYINAGHNPPYFYRADGKLEELKIGGLILGCLEEPFPYLTGEVDIKIGESILIFTDGVNEALDEHDVEYGDENLQASFKRYADKPAQDILNGVLSDVKYHFRHASQYDDLTMIVMKREA